MTWRVELNTEADVRRYFQALADGSRHRYSLVDNQRAFKVLESKENEWKMWALIASVNFEEMRRQLCTQPHLANRPVHYQSIAALLDQIDIT